MYQGNATEIQAIEKLELVASWRSKWVHTGKRTSAHRPDGVIVCSMHNGVDRAGNPDFLAADMPSPAGAFAYNNALVSVRKTTLEHRPGWDDVAASKSHVFRRDL